ncbi:hypothetical protein ACFYVR_09720 [Rhodococcus sp. NPDC003318]|uniref:hypothetical protein n=1 Tax=Rhodococcus sp. NPDC003318 TaxID=3364503 RepID=UPI0036B7F424
MPELSPRNGLPSSAPVLPPPEPSERVDEPAGGGEVDLHTLLSMALLTPAQAALLIDDVTRQLAVGRGRFIGDRSVTVSRDGQLTIAGAGDTGTERDVTSEAARVLRAIAAACHDRSCAERVDESISEAADLADLSRRVSGAVAVDLDPSTVDRTRHQIATLVAATRRSLSDGAPTGEAAGASLAPAGWLPSVENPWHRRKWRLSKRQFAVAVTVIGLIVGAVWAAPGAWTQLRLGWNTLLAPESQPAQDQISPVSPPETPAPAPGSPAAPVNTGLPGSAGPVTDVTATFANGNCAVGQQCLLRVDVRVDPRANVSAVTWKLTVYDRCTGAVLPGADVTMPVPSGEQEVYGIGSVAVPADTAVAIAALTSVPAAAASDPVYVPAENSTCP